MTPKRPLPRKVPIVHPRKPLAVKEPHPIPQKIRPVRVDPIADTVMAIPHGMTLHVLQQARQSRYTVVDFNVEDRYTGYGFLPRPTVRHLLYHVYPRHHSLWRNRVLAIRENLKIFNGVKAIAIAYDGTTDHPNLVKDALADCGCTFVEVRNDPSLREVATFEPLFNQVKDFTGPEHCTLYGHAKAVTRARGTTCHNWAATLEEMHLKHWDIAERLLTKYSCAGCFLERCNGWGPTESLSTWHYSGSWYWFRNDAIFTLDNWQSIDLFWSGIEPYLSNHVNGARAGVIFGEGSLPSMCLYNAEVWANTVYPALRTFRMLHPESYPPGD